MEAQRDEVTELKQAATGIHPGSGPGLLNGNTKSMVPQIRPSSMAPQKVLEDFRRNRFLLGAASNPTLPDLLLGLGWAG